MMDCKGQSETMEIPGQWGQQDHRVKRATKGIMAILANRVPMDSQNLSDLSIRTVKGNIALDNAGEISIASFNSDEILTGGDLKKQAATMLFLVNL
ncbi:MAG: hypothetical protein WKF36_12085 [Candidatus Nitrosocosmicus sp.]